MTLVQQLRRQLAELEARLRPLDHQERDHPLGTLNPPSRWFPQGLFHCQSQHTLDYFRELSALVDKLELLLAQPQWKPPLQSAAAKTADSQAHTQAMVERIGQQFQMLYRFIQRRAVELRPRHKHQRLAPQPLPENLHGLYQRLRQQQDYERRLEEMINIRQQQLTLVSTTEADKIEREIQQYSQRLMRCKHATRQVEVRIAQLESR